MPAILNTIKTVESTPYGDYPRTCSFCRFFSYAKVENVKGSPIVDFDSAYCVYHSNPYKKDFRFDGINPLLEIPEDCRRFSLPRYYYA